jgi:Tol biopolymer transport system component
MLMISALTGVGLGPVAEITTARFLPDGKRILLQGSEKGKPSRFWIADPPSAPRAASPEGLLGSADLLSPDGRSVVCWSADTSVLAILPIEGGPQRPLAGTEYDDPVGWTSDNRSLYSRRSPGQGRRVYTLDVETLARKAWKDLTPPDPASAPSLPQIAFAPDGSAYAYSFQRVLTSDLYVVEGLK